MTPLKTLDTLLSEMKTHTPDIAKVVGPLMSELRMIADRGFADTRNRLDLDLTNLAQGLDDVISMKRIGIVDGDIAIAEAAMMTLAIDMRSRAISIIKDRAAAIRIHAEVAAGRADPDIEPMDLTDGYRLMAAMPVDAHGDEDGLIIQSLGLPEKGGQAGRIMGDVLMFTPYQDSVYNDMAGPVETFYLPAGRSVRLQHGEQIRIHDHGYVTDGVNITLNHFQNASSYREVEAVSDDVIVYGPMTFEISQHQKLSQIRLIAEKLSACRGTYSKKQEHLMKPENAGWYMLSASGTSILGFGVGAIIEGLTTSTALALTALVPATVLAFLSAGSAGYQYVMGHKLKNRIPADLKASALALGPGFTDSKLFASMDKSEHFIRAVNQRITLVSTSRFYPLRKLVVKEREGVRVIEPLKAIAAPVPEMNMNDTTVIKMKTRA